MKSEERHQLLTNDLQVVTTQTVGFAERHLGTVIAIVCGVLVVVAAGTWWSNASNTENAAGWTMLDSATNLEEFGDVVDKYKGTPPGQWAQLRVSEKTLQNALPLMFSNRAIANADLKRAREGFDSLLQQKNVSPVIRERSLWGLALCLEAGCDGDTSKAREAYERLLTDFPTTYFKVVAEDRIAALKRSDAGEFYAWFSKENPKPPEARPRDFKPNGVDLPAPKDPDDDDFDAEMKAKVPGEKPAAEKPATDEKPAPAGEKKDDGAKPEEKPAADKPADSPKAEDKTPENKPAESKPAEEKPVEAKPPEKK